MNCLINETVKKSTSMLIYGNQKCKKLTNHEVIGDPWLEESLVNPRSTQNHSLTHSLIPHCNQVHLGRSTRLTHCTRCHTHSPHALYKIRENLITETRWQRSFNCLNPIFHKISMELEFHKIQLKFY